MAQLDPEESVVPQLFVCEKAPLEVMPAIDKFEPPVFVSVTNCGELEVATNCDGNVRVEGDKETAGGVTPVPLNEARRLDPFVPFMVRSPLRGPGAVGVNVMLKLQVEPPGVPRIPPGPPRMGQVVLCAKSPVI